MKRKILIIVFIILLLVLLSCLVYLLFFEPKSKNEKYYSCINELSEDEEIREYSEAKVYYKKGIITKCTIMIHDEIRDDDVYEVMKKEKKDKDIVDTYKTDHTISYSISIPDDIIGKSIEIFTKNDIYKCTLKED